MCLQIISSSLLVSSVAVSSCEAAALLPLLVAVIVPSSPSATTHSLYQELSALLPSAAVPDKIAIVDQLPINSHGQNLMFSFLFKYHHYIGKLDMKQLSSSLASSASPPGPAGVWSRESFLSFITTTASEVLNISWRSDDDTCTLSSLGASSFDVLRLLNVISDKLTSAAPITGSGLYEALLTKPLKQVVTVFTSLLENRDETDIQDSSMKMVSVDELASRPLDRTIAVVPTIKSWRRGQFLENGRFVT